jgi:hypothetical protein
MDRGANGTLYAFGQMCDVNSLGLRRKAVSKQEVAMSNSNGSAAAPNGTAAEREAAAEKFSDALNESLRKIGMTEKTTMIALMGVVAVIASLPETPKLDPLRVGKIVGALVRGRSDEAELRKSVSIAAARIITVAQQVDAEPPPPADKPPQA